MFSYLIKGCFQLSRFDQRTVEIASSSPECHPPHSLTPTTLEQDAASPRLWLVERNNWRAPIGCHEFSLRPSPGVGSRYDPELLQKPSFKSLATYNWMEEVRSRSEEWVRRCEWGEGEFSIGAEIRNILRTSPTEMSWNKRLNVLLSVISHCVTRRCI